MIKKLVIIFLFTVMMIFMFSQIHEVTHYQIGHYYGCDGEIKWDFLDINKTITKMYQGDQVAFMSTNWDGNCQMSEIQTLAHSMNEVIGYNVVPLLEIIMCLIFTFLILRSSEKPPEIKINIKKKKKGNLTVVDIK